MIKKLPQDVVEKIAAGEVVERPASIVKELLENAFDAGADTIKITLLDAGKEFIEVSDNGSGISRDELTLAVEPHATSKIQNVDDLFSIHTLGFRGEALASICAVSKTTITSKTQDAVAGSQIIVEGGIKQDITSVPSSIGTTIAVKDLFYNVPARKKFLKTTATEMSTILQVVTPYCISNEHSHIEVWHNKKQTLLAPKADLRGKISAIYGTAIAKYAKEVSYTCTIELNGLTSDPMHTRSDKQGMILIVNNRWVKNANIIQAITQGYGQLLMGGRYPVGVYKITIDPQKIDVNIHPSKDVIKFDNEQEILEEITQAIAQTFEKKEMIRDATVHAQITQFKIEEESLPVVQENRLPQIQKHHSQSIQTTQYEFKPVEKKPILSQGVLEKTESEVTVDSSHMRYLGLVNRTYAVLEENNGLILVDFHAAHERYLYELIKRDLENKSTATQQLISPMQMTLTPQDMNTANENKDILEKLGFYFDEFGTNSVLLRSVPKIFHKQMKPEYFVDVLNSITKNSDIADSIMIRMSCRSADKAGDDLSDEKIKSIIRQVASEGHKYSCPHGRPIFVRITTMELEKMFKRRV